jgi:hypothetical protein
MRTMDIDRFGKRGEVQFSDLGAIIKQRLRLRRVIRPDQAILLLAYMAWPDDSETRTAWVDAHRRDDEATLWGFCRKLKLIQQHWARIADIVQRHHGLTMGDHQKQRGGASVGKAITLVAAQAKNKGTGVSKLWEIWKHYQDVAHLIIAATEISYDAWLRNQQAPFVKHLHELQPYEMAMLMPDLVLAVAMSWQDYGLDYVSWGGKEPLFDPESLWRIPGDIGLSPVPILLRNITTEEIRILNARRAGNRGRARQITRDSVIPT